MSDIPDSYQIVMINVANDQDRAFIQQQLREFNNRRSPHHQEVRVHGPQPLDLFIRDAEGQLIGGLIGSTVWRWLQVEDLWLHDHLRGQGYGQRLLLDAEAEARRRGCVRAHLTTFSFQARGFYEKFGYRVVGQLDDFPPGGAFYWMRKDFAP